MTTRAAPLFAAGLTDVEVSCQLLISFKAVQALRAAWERARPASIETIGGGHDTAAIEPRPVPAAERRLPVPLPPDPGRGDGPRRKRGTDMSAAVISIRTAPPHAPLATSGRDLAPTGCRWICGVRPDGSIDRNVLGEASGVSTPWCDAPRVGVGSWCAEHLARVSAGGSSREEDAAAPKPQRLGTVHIEPREPKPRQVRAG